MVGIKSTAVPVVPADAALCSATVEECDRVTFADLLDKGYLSVQHLSVSHTCDFALLVDAAQHHIPSAATTLTSRGMPLEYVSRRADGGTASFRCGIGSMGLPRLLRERNVVQTLVRLVLPLQVGASSYFHLAGEIALPVLQTLAVLFGGQRGQCSVFDPGVVYGAVNAPLISRLELLADSDPTESDVGAPVNPDHIAEFIESYLGAAAPARIEVFVDSKRGVRLESGTVAGLERLRRCTRKLIV
ncbi:hypothetical protein AURDEDRAFT_112630 [Auricularia subglabra TFB-10046 SS5]|nr:hypothetical protein AURDEDRAFT_112630 [Auricularia subglabra TFB-10046 SS5]